MTAERSFSGRCLVNAAALWLASLIVPGMHVPAQPTTLFLTLLMFALIYELVCPLLSLLTFPLVLLLVIPLNIAVHVVILIATVAASRLWGSSLEFDGFLRICWAAVAVGLIRLLLTEFVRLHEKRRTICEQREWIQELKQAKVWLTEQVFNWRRIAEEREHILHEQQAWIEELQTAKAWLASEIARSSVHGSD